MVHPLYLPKVSGGLDAHEGTEEALGFLEGTGGEFSLDGQN